MARLRPREKQSAQMTAVKEGRKMNRACYKQFTLHLNPALNAERLAVVTQVSTHSFKVAAWDKLVLIPHLLQL